MTLRRILALTGPLLLFLGVFVPIYSVPIIGNVNYFNNGRGDGVIILGLVAISVPFALLKRFHWLWATGVGSLILIGYSLLNLRSQMFAMTAQVYWQLGRNPLRESAFDLMQVAQLQWGWALLTLGSAFTIASAAIQPSADRRKCPHCAESIRTAAAICRYCSREVPSTISKSRKVSRMPLRVAIVTAAVAVIVPAVAWTFENFQAIREILYTDYGIKLP